MLSCARGCPTRAGGEAASAVVAPQPPPAPPALGARLVLQGEAGEDELKLILQPGAQELEGLYLLGSLGPIALRGTRTGARLRLEEVVPSVGGKLATLDAD